MTDDEVFDQDDDGIVLLRCHAVPVDHQERTVPVDHQERIREAVGLCPSGALSLLED